MCGIFGIVYGPLGPAGEPWSPEDLMQLMFPAIEHRGPHAWGYMVHHQGADEVDYYRSPGSCKQPGASGQMVTAPDSPPIDWLVGHVRFATTGDPNNNANNHPLESHNGVIGVHNGVLRGDWAKVLKAAGGRKDRKAQVDSEAIFAAVGKWGSVEGLRMIEGSMVAVYTMLDNPAVLYIARSFGRPLVYATTEAGSLIFASEREVLDATGIKLKNIVDWKAGNTILTVEGGLISKREQYRIPMVDAPSRGQGAMLPPVHGSLPTSTDVRGITDRMTPDKPRRAYDESIPRPLPDMMLNQVDDWGGRYVGGNIWITADGVSLNANDYIRWVLAAEMAAANFTQADDAGVEYNSTETTALSS